MQTVRTATAGAARGLGRDIAPVTSTSKITVRGAATDVAAAEGEVAAAEGEGEVSKNDSS